MNYRTARALSKVLAYTGIGILIIALLFLKSPVAVTLLVVVGIILILLNAIICYFFYRCPYCHYVLPYRNSTIPAHCPGCGKELNAKTDINN